MEALRAGTDQTSPLFKLLDIRTILKMLPKSDDRIELLRRIVGRMDLPDDVETLIAYSDPELFDPNRPQASKSRHMHFATAVRPKPQGTSSAVSNTPRGNHYRWVQQDLDEYGRPEPYRRLPNGTVCPVSQRPMKLKYHSQYIMEFKDEWSTGGRERDLTIALG